MVRHSMITVPCHGLASASREREQTMTTTITSPRRLGGLLPPKRVKERIPLASTGRPVRFRLPQQVGWGAGALAAGAAVVAGFYFNTLQVRWHIDIGSVHAQWLYLKTWWDSWAPLPKNLGTWALYRHGYRDDGESAVALLAVLIATAAGGAMVGRKMGKIRLITGPVILLALAFLLITGAIWLQFYGLPHAWHAFGLTPIHGSPQIAEIWAVAETFAFGFLVGHLLKFYWKPIAGHLQGVVMDRSVDAFWRRQGQQALGLSGHVQDDRLSYPLWIRLPLAPPGLRETWSKIVAGDIASGEADRIIKGRAGAGHTAEHGKWARWLITAALVAGGLILLYFMITGAIAHFWVGTGHNFPYLAPPKG